MTPSGNIHGNMFQPFVIRQKGRRDLVISGSDLQGAGYVVTDFSGRTICRGELLCDDGGNAVVKLHSALSKGIYFLTIRFAKWEENKGFAIK